MNREHRERERVHDVHNFVHDVHDFITRPRGGNLGELSMMGVRDTAWASSRRGNPQAGVRGRPKTGGFFQGEFRS